MSRLYDPLDSLIRRDPLASLLRGVQQPQGPSFPPLEDQEADSLLRQIGSGAMSGLGYVGSTLDKALGGRAIRGVLGGRPEEALSLIPFSDTLGITDQANAVSGRDLLENAGLLQPNEPGLDLGDVLGFGAEVLLDPSTYVTLGGSALSRGGQVAKRIGAIPKTRVGRLTSSLDDLLKSSPELIPAAERAAGGLGVDLAQVGGEKLGGLVGVGLPFSSPSFAVGSGPFAQRLAQGLDTAGEMVRWSAPGRYANALFNRDVKMAMTPEGQRAGMAASEAERKGLAELQGVKVDVTRGLAEAGMINQGSELRQVAEGFVPPPKWFLHPGESHYGAMKHDITDQAGDVVGELTAIVKPDGNLEIDWLGKPRNVAENAPLHLGPEGVRSVLEQMTKYYPGASSFEAKRVSGIRGRNLPASGEFDSEAPIITKSLAPIRAAAEAGGARNRPLRAAAKQMTDYLDQLNKRAQSVGVDTKLLDDTLEGVQRFTKDEAGNVIGIGGDPNLFRLNQQYYDQLEKLAGPQAEYFPRFRGTLTKETAGYGTPFSERFLSPQHRSLQAREDFLRNIPGGTNTIEEIVGQRGSLLAGDDLGAAKLRAAAEIRSKYLGMTPEMEQAWLDLKKVKELSPQQELEKKFLDAKVQQSHQLADMLARIDPQYAQTGFFSNHPVADFATSAAGRIQAEANANAIIGMFIDSRAGPEAVGRGPNVPLRDAFKQAGLTDDALRAAAERLGVTPAEAAKIQVPQSMVNDATRFNKGFTTPEVLQPLVKAADWFTNLFRPLATVAFPAHLVRNYVSGLWTNFVRDAGDPRFGLADPRKWIEPQKDMKALLGGKTIKAAGEIPLLRGMTDEQATKAVADLMAQHGVVHHAGGAWDRATTDAGEDILRSVPGMEPTGLANAAKEFIPRSLAEANPLNVTGVGRSNLDQFAPVRGGRAVASLADNMNRGAAYIAYLRQGYDPVAAADLVKEMHYDFSRLTDVERQVFRRIIPFYTWQRLNLPQQLQQIAEHPGGKVAQAIRAGEKGRDDAGYVPEHIGEGTAIPLPGAAPGQARFLSSIGLPYESGLDQLSFGPGGVGRTVERLLGQTNPLLKVPLELLTGKQFFSGRDLGDLYQYPTPSGTINELVANTPGLGRLSSTARTVMDPRKDLLTKLLNLGTGARVTDVDVQKSMEIEGKNLLEEIMRGSGKAKEFTRLYIPEAERANLSPEEVQLMQLYSTLQKRAELASLEKKAAAGDPEARRRLQAVR